MPTNTPVPPPNEPWEPAFTPGETVSVSSSGSLSQYINTLGSFNRKSRRVAKGFSYDATLSLEPKKGFTFGCDPEAFLFNKKTGKPVPAAGLLPGTKEEPHKVNKGAIQVDGLAAEFNIDPASTYREWEDNITTVVAQLEKELPKGLELRWVPFVEFAPEDFDKAPDSAKELGCDPDIDAYTGGTNSPPRLDNPYERCAGGHVHFGFEENADLSDLQHLLNCQDVGKQADWFLGGWSVTKDQDVRRRKMYGKMGSIRYKPYGVEYRVMSNFWVPDKQLRLDVWNRMVSTVNNIGNYFLPDRVGGRIFDDLKRAINEGVINEELEVYGTYPIRTLDSNYTRL